MGLDSHILVREKPTLHEQIYDKLIGDETEWREVIYWRKEWDVVEFFGDLLGVEIENCEKYDITESNLRDLLLALKEDIIIYRDYQGKEEEQKKEDIIMLEKFLKDMDFTKIEMIFDNWW